MNCPLCHSPRPEKWPVSGKRYFRCVICDLVWLDVCHRLSAHEEKARYEKHDNVLNKQYLTYLSQFSSVVRPYLKKAGNGLDYGAGPVEGMKALLEPDYSIQSYDPFFFANDELMNNSYDFVLCSEVVEHFFEPAKEFSRFATLLKAGGILAISSQLFPGREKFEDWTYRRDPTHVTFYSENTVNWIAKNLQWKILCLESPVWVLQATS